MKDKRLKYILFPAVALIWGFAFYKYFIYSEDPKTPAANPITNAADLPETKSPTKSIVPYIYELIGEYRDPFLGNMAQSRRKGPPAPPTAEELRKNGALPPVRKFQPATSPNEPKSKSL
ncbi:MAG: hypothetical protein AAF570_07440, partial [Bacteroidota bacterium]